MQHGGRKILVIDLGGTNLRAAFGNPEDNELSDVQKIKLDCINEFYKILGELIDRYPIQKIWLFLSLDQKMVTQLQ